MEYTPFVGQRFAFVAHALFTGRQSPKVVDGLGDFGVDLFWRVAESTCTVYMCEKSKCVHVIFHYVLSMLQLLLLLRLLLLLPLARSLFGFD